MVYPRYALFSLSGGVGGIANPISAGTPAAGKVAVPQVLGGRSDGSDGASSNVDDSESGSPEEDEDDSDYNEPSPVPVADGARRGSGKRGEGSDADEDDQGAKWTAVDDGLPLE